MPTPVPRPASIGPRAVALLCALLLGGCGTSIQGLLSKQGTSFWEAEQLIEMADARSDQELAAVLVAEEIRAEKCARIHAAVMDRMELDSVPFWEQFWSDLGQLVALVVPIPLVERCAEAHEDYYEALDGLRESLRHDSQQTGRSPQVLQIGWRSEQVHRGR